MRISPDMRQTFSGSLPLNTPASRISSSIRVAMGACRPWPEARRKRSASCFPTTTAVISGVPLYPLSTIRK
ncbi:hypothetical protein BCR35DRAFT_311314 [Leucosporidium creatinivorum]|uniref:Uncharacterized protein n=1 Tax=Leucosporidium creatinivorum TaxID=106004 RepID=A0A1Y2C465_9BASI|nr:hypothetical protein BCR35DRAFT_311314 [Leucosporidium creatinivorum]